MDDGGLTVMKGRTEDGKGVGFKKTLGLIFFIMRIQDTRSGRKSYHIPTRNNKNEPVFLSKTRPG